MSHQAGSAPMVIGTWSTLPEQRPLEGSPRYSAVDRAMSSGLLEYLNVQTSQVPASRVSAVPFTSEQRVWSEYADDLEQDEWDDALSQAIDGLVASVG